MPKRIPRDINWLIKKYLDFFRKYGLSETMIREIYEKWLPGTGLITDFIWFIFEYLLTEIAKQKTPLALEFHRLTSDVYNQMAMYLIKEGKRNPNYLLKKFHYHELCYSEIATTNFVVEVEILSRKCCPYCDNINGLKMTIEEAKEKQLLASENCTNARNCTCSYLVKPLRGDDRWALVKG